MTKTKSTSATIRDVAREARVSVATVSRYLNQNASVSPEVVARLETVMAELNYAPHATARKLATHKTYTIGLLLTDIHGDFFAPLFSGIESVTSENGFDLLISTRQPERRKGTSHPLGPHNTDGLLIFADSLDAQGLTQLHTKGFPMVLIHQSPPEPLEIPCVTVENKAASRKIVEHLIEVHRKRHIVFLSGPQEQEDSRWRELGYRQALNTHGIPFDPDLVVPGEFDRNVAQTSIRNLINHRVRFDAVFSGDDEAAVGVLSALHEAGILIPDDVSVVGFDDQRMSPYLTPPLTTVRAPTEEVGREAARQLIRFIHGQELTPLTLLPTEIVIRRSCGCA
jgi:DNA-binding LacI/PurR family transcriptional regulator